MLTSVHKILIGFLTFTLSLVFSTMTLTDTYSKNGKETITIQKNHGTKKPSAEKY